MITEAFFSSVLGAVSGVSILAFISKKWIEARLQESIKHEYDIKIEKVREASIVKAKAQLVAELFAEWLSFPDDQRRLNQLTLEAFLWLPEDILRDLSDLLSHKQGAPEVRELVVRVRAHLLGSSSLPPYQVILFSQETLEKMTARHQTELAKRSSVEAQQGAQADVPASGGSAA